MSAGTGAVKLISDGTFLLDGGAVFGQVPKVQWELHSKPDRRNRIRLGLNCLLIQAGGHNILVDTGAGSKRLDKFKDSLGLNGNKLLKGLKDHGLSARDIDIVVLSHLHFDHSGGCTKLDRSGEVLPTFPKAKHLIQKACWDEATKPNERAKPAYDPDDFMPLQEKGLVTLLDGDTQVAPGVKVKMTGGHCSGHQVVLVEHGSERIAFAGDLIPTPHHLPLPCISAYDQTPNATMDSKRELLEMATKGGWLVVFGHAAEQRAGYVEYRNGRAQVQPVEM